MIYSDIEIEEMLQAREKTDFWRSPHDRLLVEKLEHNCHRIIRQLQGRIAKLRKKKESS